MTVEVPLADPPEAPTEARDLATVLIEVAKNTWEDSVGEASTLTGMKLVLLSFFSILTLMVCFSGRGNSRGGVRGGRGGFSGGRGSGPPSQGGGGAIPGGGNAQQRTTFTRRS